MKLGQGNWLHPIKLHMRLKRLALISSFPPHFESINFLLIGQFIIGLIACEVLSSSFLFLAPENVSCDPDGVLMQCSHLRSQTFQQAFGLKRLEFFVSDQTATFLLVVNIC